MNYTIPAGFRAFSGLAEILHLVDGSYLDLAGPGIGLGQRFTQATASSMSLTCQSQ